MTVSSPAFLSPAPVLARASSCIATRSARPSHRPAGRRSSAPRAVATDPSSSAATTPTNTEAFDYVIIGGGAAGCVLANRLSEDRKVSVLLLEAGGPPDDFYLHVPLGFPYLLGSSRDWAFVTEPEPQLGNRRLYFPRGRLLGGSHAISVMLYHRGDPADYRAWESSGATGWGPEDVLPYFRRSERQTNRESDPEFHGFKGPLSVSDLAKLNPMSQAFIDAAQSAGGLQANGDFNDWSASQDGVGPFQVTQRAGVRESPATAYLAAASGRRNLTVRTGVTVERLQIDSTDDAGASVKPMATGAHYVDSDGRHHFVRAKSEVLLAGGVYASPQLLLLSGVGPASQLSTHDIPLVTDLAGVGQNLQDHPAAMLSYLSASPSDKRRSGTFYTERTGRNLGTLLNYIFRGRGPLTSPMCEAGGFVRSDPELTSCDLQLRFIPFVSEPNPYESLADFARGGAYLRNRAQRPAGFTLQSVVARPRSRGSVELRSVDVRDSMRIRANWMSDERDMASLVAGIELCRKIARDDRFKDFRGAEKHPGGDVVSKADIEQYVRESVHTANAMVGTCRMGNDEEAVVTPDLKVRGVDRLRVVDSSVMPTIPGGQTGAPTMMIAEKAADLIQGNELLAPAAL